MRELLTQLIDFKFALGLQWAREGRRGRFQDLGDRSRTAAVGILALAQRGIFEFLQALFRARPAGSHALEHHPGQRGKRAEQSERKEGR
jgi:hypothetical protein